MEKSHNFNSIDSSGSMSHCSDCHKKPSSQELGTKEA